MQCGKHGYSARDYGFRFDIEVDGGDVGSSGGRTDTKCDRSVANGRECLNKEEKEREVNKDKGKDKEGSKDKDKDKKDGDKEKEGKKEESVISDPLEARGGGVPCDDPMRECASVPIPVPIHPHAGDPLLVEDPGIRTTHPLALSTITFILYLYLYLYPFSRYIYILI